jgi:hypothetical protein
MATATEAEGATDDRSSRRVHLRSRLAGVDPVVGVMVLLLPLVRVLMVLPVTPSVYPDGPTYRTQNTWLDFSLTSFDGHSIRPWGVTAWMALWPNTYSIMVAQALLSAVAWGTFALVVASGIENRVVRRVFAAAIVLLACSAQLANWDSVMQGDSVPMSTGVLSLAALVWLVRRPTWGRAALFAAAALWFTMSRPNTFVVLLFWAVGLLAIGLMRRRVLVLGLTAVLLLVFCGYSYVYNVRSDTTWTAKLGYSRTTVGMAYPLGHFDPVAGQVLRDLRRSDAPACMFVADPLTAKTVGTTAKVAAKLVSCPQMDVWATANWQRWWAGWLLAHPKGALAIIRSQLPQSLSPSVWGQVVAATPNSVSAVFLGTQTLPQDAVAGRTYRTQPLIFWFISILALAVAAAVRRRWRARTWEIDLALAVTVLGGLACAVSSGLLIQTLPYEVSQESLAATAVITGAAVALVAIGIDRLLTSPPDARPEGDAAADARVPASVPDGDQEDGDHETEASRPSVIELQP